MTANKLSDGPRIRSILFDPNVPDYAFLTQEEVLAAFNASEATLRRWAMESGFPDPVGYPGIKG